MSEWEHPKFRFDRKENALYLNFGEYGQEVEVADRDLCALKDQYTQVQPDGSRAVSWPPECKDYPQYFYWDTLVCDR